MTQIDRDPAADAFRPKGPSNVTLLVQPRPRRNSAYVIYGDALDAPEIHIHMRVTEDLRRATLDAVRNEAIGVLLGRPCRDVFGIYVVVENAMTAAYGEYADPHGAVSISAAGRTAMHRRAAQRHPTLEPVGWWRSHPRGMPRSSSLDLDEQDAYPRPYHVGIVVAAEHLDDPPSHAEHVDPLGVYVGRSGTRLGCRTRERDQVSKRFVAVSSAVAWRTDPTPDRGQDPVHDLHPPLGHAG
jgi:proteasome lid subunit RPN8/RPN11